jgi:hypothetical protein
MQESPGTDPTAEAAGCGRGRRRLTLTVVRHGRAQRLTGVRVFLSYSGQFLMRFAPTDHNDEENMFMLTLIGREGQQSPAMVRQVGRCLSTVRAASGEASAARTCTKLP